VNADVQYSLVLERTRRRYERYQNEERKSHTRNPDGSAGYRAPAKRSTPARMADVEESTEIVRGER